jgi:hypothetical protein
MANDIHALVDELWQSADRCAEARKARSALTAADRNRLGRIAQTLEQRAAARRVLASDLGVEPVESVGMTDERLEGLLVLLTLAAHHSDSLLYLPFELREAKLREWADSTGYSVDVVREAGILGPSGLLPLLRAA